MSEWKQCLLQSHRFLVKVLQVMFLGFSLLLDCELRWRQRKATSCVQYACLDSSSFSSVRVVDCESTTCLFHCKRRQMHQCRSTKAMQSALIFNARQLFKSHRQLRHATMALVTLDSDACFGCNGSITWDRLDCLLPHESILWHCYVCVIVRMPSILTPLPSVGNGLPAFFLLYDERMEADVCCSVIVFWWKTWKCCFLASLFHLTVNSDGDNGRRRLVFNTRAWFRPFFRVYVLLTVNRRRGWITVNDDKCTNGVRQRQCKVL